MIVKQYIGVDMAKATFDACFGDSQSVKTFPNTTSGITRLFRCIGKDPIFLTFFLVSPS